VNLDPGVVSVHAPAANLTVASGSTTASAVVTSDISEVEPSSSTTPFPGLEGAMLYYCQIGTSGCTTSGISDLSAANVSYAPLTPPTGTTCAVGSTLCDGTWTSPTITGLTVDDSYEFVVVGFDFLGHQASAGQPYSVTKPIVLSSGALHPT